MISPENLLLVGKVIRPHGLDGLLRIWSYAQSEESFLNAGTVFLKSDQQELFEYQVISVKPHKKFFLMRLKGLNSLEDAERYSGAKILINKDFLKRESEDEYFWFELIGLQVYLNSGRHIGTLKDIITTGSNDIYVIREGDAEFLIPAIHEVVEEIDLENKRMIISETEGLFELDEV
ncbi:ribosome maturation factor RimM [Thermodesulfobacteriota bacterium]